MFLSLGIAYGEKGTNKKGFKEMRRVKELAIKF